MDNKTKFYNFLKIAKKAGALTEGYNRTEENLKKNNIFLVFISKDLSANSKNKFKNYALKYKFTLIEDAPMDEIGNELLNSELRILGVKDKSFGKNLQSLYMSKDEYFGGE
ncbi:ribosomal L7Ae/L30e/S12e/Gadd45 family protein [Hathewaya limosa]|uniref:Ribosomal protein L7Ae-like RNA K-turn-binding protein n=1 Tax=Hathewaya limosa TaxID=1536 RepID=A0ABU0JV90_HATLI|nr:ribosomal L7Ae/L30e/S12e/Gadd45 family protein [Hathewaya limosa]MDQ0480131.1 ribosomal protein L7Ae-like RNA K-turn-binding protein [Hathewaya limosa]